MIMRSKEKEKIPENTRNVTETRKNGNVITEMCGGKMSARFRRGNMTETHPVHALVKIFRGSFRIFKVKSSKKYLKN